MKMLQPLVWQVAASWYRGFSCCCFVWRCVTRRWFVARWRGARKPSRSRTAGLGEEHCTQTLPAQQPVPWTHCVTKQYLHKHTRLSQSFLLCSNTSALPHIVYVISLMSIRLGIILKYVCLPLCVKCSMFIFELFITAAFCCYYLTMPFFTFSSFSLLILKFTLSLALLLFLFLCSLGSGFVESAFLYPLDLAGLEHMQSAFSLYHRYGTTSHCEYHSTVSVSWLALER